MGQFLTPPQVAQFMASLLEPRTDHVGLLDPGAGVGSLSAAMVAELCNRQQRPKSISLTAYELDGDLAGYLRQTVEECERSCERAGIGFSADVIQGDFIRAGVEMLADRRLLESDRKEFACAILNPPYRKINSQSDTRRILRAVGIETSNLYAAFLWLVFRLLKTNGEMIAITPRSFCNGPYFRPFRQAFLREMTIDRIHVFESRKTAFKDADVLQENVIFRAVKNKQSRQAEISSSTGPNDPNIFSRAVSQTELVHPNDPDSVVYIVPDELGTRFAEQAKNFPATLGDLRIQVSTGRVVDFRCKDAIAFESNGRTVPLIYPIHFERGFIVWPKRGKKPNYLKVEPETQSLLVPEGVYVLVKRFSAKEERRRVAAAVCDPDRLPRSPYGFENHLNYFHRKGGGLSASLAKGLAAYLNSTLVDSFFRQFSGHTQVNASDLRSLKYPSLEVLEHIGTKIGDSFPVQEEIDRLVREESGMAGDDPAKVKRRIEESRSVLKALGLPKAQQNERSAMTLLSLLDLKPGRRWAKVTDPLRGISQMMDWIAEHYGKRYAENTRESVRKETIHHLLEAGIIVINPDAPERPTNSGKTVYQIEAGALKLLRTFGKKEWEKNLRRWLASVETLKSRYAKARKMKRIPLRLATGEKIDLSPGGQNVLVKEIIAEFCPRFTPGGMPIYVGDTDMKWAYFNEESLAGLGVKLEAHGKMPDVVVHHVEKDWLVLIEAVTSHGPVDSKRRDELSRLFKTSTAGLVFVTAFLDRSAMIRYLGDISWETEVWVADAPSHMIHFNGERFLGPYGE
ncbi:MAG: Eco57I restriction-modification methylase domain-containing protein [Planctomycetia bacterium]|nr:Eco57I restriction-modification methylase domain-containing protein [Planctomycetia bacterium]